MDNGEYILNVLYRIGEDDSEEEGSWESILENQRVEMRGC